METMETKETTNIKWKRNQDSMKMLKLAMKKVPLHKVKLYRCRNNRKNPEPSESVIRRIKSRSCQLHGSDCQLNNSSLIMNIYHGTLRLDLYFRMHCSRIQDIG